MTQSDIISRTQESQEEEGTTIGMLADIAGFGGMFILYMGMFRLFIPDEFTNGMVTLLFGGIIFLSGLYVPGVKAALHARDKKYVNNYVFYSARMVLRRMELIEDPLVIARQTEDDEVEFVKEIDDSDYEVAVRALGAEFLTDKDVDKKMEDALKQRYEKIKIKIERKGKGLWRWPYVSKQGGQKDDE